MDSRGERRQRAYDTQRSHTPPPGDLEAEEEAVLPTLYAATPLRFSGLEACREFQAG